MKKCSSSLRADRRRPAGEGGGFTLVEIMIVITILGILAALVIPQFTNATALARASTLREDARNLRAQVMLYQSQHNGTAPGYPGGNTGSAPTNADFVAQLTLYSDATGNTSATRTTQHCYGPYLKRVPENPLNASPNVRFVAAGAVFPVAPSGAEGWVYQPSTGTLKANVAGSDETGKAFFDY